MLLYLTAFVAAFCMLANSQFQVEYEWSYVNFTWPTKGAYQKAVRDGTYVPQNNAIVAIKFYKDNIYMALMRSSQGTPVTLATMKNVAGGGVKSNPLLKPYPSWSMNPQKSCKTLQNVQSLEIDRSGIMWVLDGTRNGDVTKCPGKLVLLDLNRGGKVVYSYTFPEEICMSKGCWLNDIVLEERFGGYAYITDSSDSDPGLIVFSMKQKKSWKLRDATMFANLKVVNYTVGGIQVPIVLNMDSIAMTPVPKNPSAERQIFYSPLSSYNLHSISDCILRNETLAATSNWRNQIKFLGFRPSIGDGMIVDNKGDLYVGLITENSIAKWNIHEQNLNLKTVTTNNKEMIWPDSFGMDDAGNIYNLADFVNYFFIGPLKMSDEPKIRIFKMHIGTKSYLYTEI
ncbi:PREDICTED: major royal jelly protein 3-like [Nicrophorus vespilloides]|uniref:Major royal jelly protein 3-like n=1 Tax=Nicrophorus vespilloides TaxID=110193 RepID=A0ABM1NDM9_NICVS|nr:PREDICTED: major royal jelly protein 3-like [Nicrophorus vespilloides]